VSNPRRHARQLARALSRAAENVPFSGRIDRIGYGVPLQADRARSLRDLAFTAGPERVNALLFCRELIEQLETAIDAIPEDPGPDYFYERFDREITKARNHVLALREALENPFGPSLRTRLASLVAPLIPEMISNALAARAERAALSRARKQEAELVQAHHEVRAELAGGGVGFDFESVHRPGAPGRTCKRLVMLAVCVLPANERARYAEEFRADLWDLSRGRRLGYAIRLVAYSLSLRRNLLNSVAVQREHL
jgi:hypothetical protein